MCHSYAQQGMLSLLIFFCSFLFFFLFSFKLALEVVDIGIYGF
jgi:hypothetical protein